MTVPGVMLCTAAALVMGVCIALLHLRGAAAVPKASRVTLALLPGHGAIVIMLVNGNIGAGVAVAGVVQPCPVPVRCRAARGKSGAFSSRWRPALPVWAISRLCGVVSCDGRRRDAPLNAADFGSARRHPAESENYHTAQGLDYEGFR